MNLKWLRYIILKARKIYYYEKHPRTDEEYLQCRMGLAKSYKKARKEYKNTSDNKYLSEMKKIKRRLFTVVSKTEYELCKKILNEYKAYYGKIIDEEFWTYETLKSFYYNIIMGDAETLEEAVEQHRKDLIYTELLNKFLKSINKKHLESLEDHYAFDEFLKKSRQ